MIERREAAMEKIWHKACADDPECAALMNKVQDKIFQLNSLQTATSPVGRVNVTEYVNKAHLFRLDSTGSNDYITSDADLKTVFRKVARLTHPDVAPDREPDFRLARMLYKAKDFEGLCLLHARLSMVDGEVVDEEADLAQLMVFAQKRLAVCKRTLSNQEGSAAWAALAEVQRGADPIPVVHKVLKRWYEKLDSM